MFWFHLFTGTFFIVFIKFMLFYQVDDLIFIKFTIFTYSFKFFCDYPDAQHTSIHLYWSMPSGDCRVDVRIVYEGVKIEIR